MFLDISVLTLSVPLNALCFLTEVSDNGTGGTDCTEVAKVGGVTERAVCKVTEAHEIVS